MEVQFVLEISAIALIISAIMSYITFRKSSSLTYITQERKEWRENIRKISEDMEGCSYKKRNHVLAKLKTRINAYGYMYNGELNDAHIWKVIDQIERCNQKEYDILKEQLICYLSVLLKYDWERSKKEVHGEPIRLVRALCIVATPIFLSLSLFYYVGNWSENVLASIAFVGVSVCILMFFIELGFKDGVYINTKMNLVIYVMAEFFVLGIIVVVGGFIARKICNEYMYSAILTAFVAGGLRVIENLQTAFENMKYCEGIRKIEEKYLSKKKQA